jgi:hypothetical protein
MTVKRYPVRVIRKGKTKGRPSIIEDKLSYLLSQVYWHEKYGIDDNIFFEILWGDKKWKRETRTIT